MLTTVQEIRGLPGVPQTSAGVRKWLRAQSVPTQTSGKKFLFVLSDLPEDVRLAFLRRECAGARLDPGAYDDAAHAEYLAAAPSMRATAERRAAMVRLWLSLGGAASDGERLRVVRDAFPEKGVSKATLKRHLKAVQGVAPINFAPALLPGFTGRTATAPMCDEAWAFFLTTLRDAAPEFPLIQAWRDVRDVAKVRGWAWPSRVTVMRRWNDLTEAQRLAVRLGKEEAVKRLTQPVHRDKTTIGPLEWVSLDGRTQDFWVTGKEGRAFRPVMLALVDVASNTVLGWELCETENAAATVRLIRSVCRDHGIFDRLYTDNGSAFAGHLVAGGAVHRFRNAKTKAVQPLGICRHLDIALCFALPENAQAKIAERTFAALSRAVDDRPEFRGAHAGHAPGAKPGTDVAPVPWAMAEEVVAREIARHNAETGRRAQGARGRSYWQMFEAGLKDRVPRVMTERQHYLAGLIYTPVAVDRNGQVRIDGWVYGDPLTQDALLAHHGNGRRILLGRDPENFAAPALAFTIDGRLICEGIAAIQPGAYGSTDGAREGARNRKLARQAVAKADEANAYLDEAAFRAALADLPSPQPAAGAAPARVVAPRFGSPVRGAAVATAEPVTATPELQRYVELSRTRLDRGIFARREAPDGEA